MTPDQPKITHSDYQSGGRYVAHVPGESATGYLDWEPGGENIRIATHTVVPPKIGGRGIGGLLVERFVADARELGFKIVPKCSFVAAKLAGNPDWKGLIAA